MVRTRPTARTSSSSELTRRPQSIAFEMQQAIPPSLRLASARASRNRPSASTVRSSGVFLVVLDKHVFEPRFMNLQVVDRKLRKQKKERAEHALNLESPFPRFEVYDFNALWKRDIEPDVFLEENSHAARRQRSRFFDRSEQCELALAQH